MDGLTLIRILIMGQSASKAAAESAKAALKRRPPPNISNNNISRTTIQHLDQCKVSATDSDGVGIIAPGSTNRAQQHQADTARRIANAASSRSDDAVEHSSFNHDHQKLLDLPPDLLKFLNDAGPVKRTIDKQLTSARVYDALVQDEKVEREHARQANTRVRRRMPILSTSSSSRDGVKEEEEDGTTTERTTNFSTSSNNRSSSNNIHSVFSSSKKYYLGVTRQEFFDLSMKLQGVTVDSPEWKKVIHDQYEDIAKKNVSSASSGSQHSETKMTTTVDGTKGGFGQLRDLVLLENSARYIGVPVLMKDTEGDIIGMWHNKVLDMKHALGLKAVRKNSLQFVVKNEDGVGGDVKET